MKPDTASRPARGLGPAVAAAKAAHAVHSSLDIAGLREALEEHLVRDGRSYRVLFPDSSGHFRTYLAGAREPTDVDPDARPRLREILENGDGRIRGVELSLGADTLPVRAAAALALRGETYGLFLLQGRDRDEHTVWQPLADALATELVKLQLYEAASQESSRAGMELSALNEAGELVKYVDLEVLLTKLMELSIRIMRAQVGAVVISRDGELTTGVEWGLSEEFLLSLRTPAGDPFVRSVLDASEPLLIQDAPSSDRIDTTGMERHVAGLLAIPLTTQTRKLGVIVIVNPGEQGLDEEDFHVLSTIANLSASALESALLYHEAVAYERVQAEMQLASRVQASLLPARAPDLEGLELVGWNMPCTETGGDYYDYIGLGGGRTAVVIGDATGHGMGAALMMFIVRSTLRALLSGGDDLASIFARMNDLVEEASPHNKFMTLFLGVIDRNGEKLTYASAGHDPPFVHRAEEFFEPDVKAGVPLGVLPGSTYQVIEHDLRPGDTWVLATDGIWEARNRDGDFYGKERLFRLMREGTDLSLRKLSDRVRSDILDFHDGSEHQDDITAVFLRVGPTAG